jgi:hypothetical protein
LFDAWIVNTIILLPEKKPAVATGMTLVAAMAVQNATSAAWREADSRSLDVP